MQSEIRPTSAGTERPAPGLGEVEMHPAGASVAKKCLPVAGGGRMVGPGGTYRPENYEWRNHLCVRNEHGRLVGKDPLAIPLDVLTASGHSNTTTRRFFKRLRDAHNINHPDDEDGWMVPEHPRRLTEIRECVCLPCSDGNEAEIRRCAIYDCPAWPFRMGRNSHNPRRGVNPFKKLMTEDE